jgi:hypothetical protein
MKNVSDVKNRHSESGSAGVKLVVFVVIVILMAHAGYQYIPVAYQGASFKQEMETAVIQGITMPTTFGKPVALVNEKIRKAVENSGLPVDTYVDVNQKGKVITARVYYKKDVPLLPFGIYNYEYIFDHSETPSGFLTK